MSRLRYLFLYSLFCLCTVSCSSDERSLSGFGIITYDNEESDFFATALSLESGRIAGSRKIGNTDLGVFTYHDGFYYGINDATGDFFKSGVKNGNLTVEKRIPFKTSVAWRPVASWFSWVDNETILLGSSMSGKQFVYATVDVKNMKIVASGKLDIPLPEKDFNYGGIMGRLAGDKLYVAYMLYQYEKNSAPPGDTIYLATIDYPSMKTTSITKDSRSTFPGGYIFFWQVSLEMDGDIYFIAQPGSRLRRHPKYTSAIFRIKKGDNKLDPDYFFPLCDNVNYEAYGLYDLGNGLAVTKVADKNKVEQFSDYYESNIVNYNLLDLRKKTITKMNLPADRLDFHKNVITKDGKAYFGIYGADNSSSVWSYDLKNGTINKGLRVPGQVIMLEELNL